MRLYSSEPFSEQERTVLSRYFTNLDGPVFALINLPEVVKAALFARYSRSSKSLRRLFLDEFYDELSSSLEGERQDSSSTGLRRAERLFERVISDYGDDSVAQLAGVHLAIEQVSNVATKVIEWGRLMSYLEQSTRYLDFGNRRRDGHFGYTIPFEAEERQSQDISSALDALFDAYRKVVDGVYGYLCQDSPSENPEEFRRASKAAAFDAGRGLLPAAVMSNVGVFGSPQAFEYLVMRMRASELGEVRHYAELIRDELIKVVPSFLSRLDKVDRGQAWVEYFSQTKKSTLGAVDAMKSTATTPTLPSVRLVDFDKGGEAKVLSAILFESVGGSEAELREIAQIMSPQDAEKVFKAYAGERSNRRHKPGRAYEWTSYDFEVVCDYGAFRDLQRHRLMSILWEPLGPNLGYVVPELAKVAGMEDIYSGAMDIARVLYEQVKNSSGAGVAAYVVPMGYLIRFRLQINAREAMHMIELRSQPAGHPSYRTVAQQMHQEICATADHKLIGSSMQFVDYEDYGLGRFGEELRASQKKQN